MKSLLISGDRSGAGKTSITLGLAGLLSENSVVQTYKVAMDYIDTSYLSGVTGRPSYNLDTFVQTDEELSGLFSYGAKGADIGIVEGVRGLYEGRDSFTDVGSTASIAKRFSLPTILVIDARSITRSAAALVKGFQAFDPEVRIKGVILNNTGGGHHVQKATEAIEYYCGIPVLGAVPRSPEMDLSMRHLGLVPFVEGMRDPGFAKTIGAIIRHVGAHVDLDAIKALAEDVTPEPNRVTESLASRPKPTRKIAVAFDEAFTFYYGELESVLRSQGSEVTKFSPLHDTLPEADGYIFGGGYPEMFAEELSNNVLMREAILAKAKAGVPIYAECGGLMYLTRSITLKKGWMGKSEDATYPMCGVFAGDTVMPAGKTLRYVEGTAVLSGNSYPFKGHEFHYSGVVMDPDTRFTYSLSRGTGIIDGKDGVVFNNALGTYTHLMPVSAEGILREIFGEERGKQYIKADSPQTL
ncbi:MAG: Ni-sirohydrochlorin a,c-diamide synthase [Methanocorpusculum sp.]|uniref:Ni-sirohydrochlorin a,c-diamide synthase n=1 Tax=Methanocorpusculum sp. TaxID=2058474 RepID=UPI00272705FD|nr:Ni-sirohydrochlorin a,c-diamide synthase [Methanocorpusculum sp.]MDO9523564.1 Ni-sirohydrochlorin a,c-diamide synthase [Methanocorpusculum sp.]